MAIGSLPPVTNEIQANSGQPGKTLAQQTAANSLLDLQATATAEPAAAIVPETTLIEQAVSEALGRQGGLAPLYATLAELSEAPDLPDALKAAVETVLAFRLGEGDVTPERVAQAIRASGLFHEATVAGKMAAVFPPAVRQALGATSEQGQSTTTRTASPTSSTSLSVAGARPASSAPPSPSLVTAAAPNLAVTASAAQAYGRQGTLPTSSATPGASPPSGLGRTVDPAAAPETPNAALAAAPSANQAGSATDASTVRPTIPAAPQPEAMSAASANAVAPQAPSGVPAGTVPAAASTLSSSALLLPSPDEGFQVASPPVPASILSPEVAETRPTSPASGMVAAPAPSPPVSVATPALPGTERPQVSGQTVSASGINVPPSISTPAPASQTPETPTSLSQAPAVSSASAADEATSYRSFAPWTPGRPLTSAVPPAPSGMPAASSPASSHPAATLPIAQAGGEIARPVGERAPFVPSAVENLPTTRSVATSPQPTATPAAPHPTAEVLRQQPGATQPTSPSSGGQLQPGTPSSQGAAQPGQQAAPQIRPASPPSTGEISSSARLSSPQPATVAAATAAMGVDLKGALELLRRELVTWLGQNADVMASLDGAGNEAPASRADRPTPPRKAGPVRGQPAMSLPGGDEADTASTETLAGRALGEAERSLSRVFLHQAATAESRDAKAGPTAQAFMFEIPIAGPTGTSIAEFRIERDDHAPTEPGAPPRRVFQADIAFDVAPLGPVAVRVGLMDGRRVAVGVWCESDDGLVRMEAERENIVLGLEQEGMVVAGVDLHRGHPPEGRDETAVAANHRLDLQL